MMPRMQDKVSHATHGNQKLRSWSVGTTRNPSGRLTQLHSIMCTRSQSGQIQVGPLLMPHLFSSKQSGQI